MSSLIRLASKPTARVILSGERSQKSKFCEATSKTEERKRRRDLYNHCYHHRVILSEQSESNPVGAPQAGSTSLLSLLSLSLYRSDRTAVALPMVGFRLRKRRTVAFSSLKMTRKIKNFRHPLVGTGGLLRFGHARVLTPHCGVIHCTRAASLPGRSAAAPKNCGILSHFLE